MITKIIHKNDVRQSSMATDKRSTTPHPILGVDDRNLV